MHDFTRRTVLQGGTALAAAGALTGPALLEWAKAWKILALNERRASCTDIRLFDLSNIRKCVLTAGLSPVLGCLPSTPPRISMIVKRAGSVHLLAERQPGAVWS